MSAHIDLYGYVRKCLLAKQITQRCVAAGSGVPYSTVSKIAQGVVKEPSVHTIQRLADFFAKEGLGTAKDDQDVSEGQANVGALS